MIFGPAIGAFEISSIAKGYFLLDQLVKKAPVKILEASPVSPGKFFILINGDEASVDESRQNLLAQVAPYLVDEIYIPFLHAEVLPAMYSQSRFPVQESVAIIETASVSSGLVSADKACKASDVHLIDFRLARGIGGKAYYFLTGTLENVEAGADAGTAALAEKGTLIRSEIIARPHDDFLSYFNVEEIP